MCESGWRNFDHNLNTFDDSAVLKDHGEQENLISEDNIVENYTTNPKQISLLYSAKTFWSSLMYTFIGFLDTLCEIVVMEMGGLLFTGLLTVITLKFFDM